MQVQFDLDDKIYGHKLSSLYIFLETFMLVYLSEKGSEVLLSLKANKLICLSYIMLTENMRLLNQRQRTLLMTV